MPKFLNIVIKPNIWQQAVVIAYSSASPDDNATVVCVDDHVVSTWPPHRKTPPDVDLDVFLSPAQSLSAKASIVSFSASHGND